MKNTIFGYKYTRSNGTDHYSGIVKYEVGRKLVHPSPDHESKVSCGIGYHVGKTLKGAGMYMKPDRIFKVRSQKKHILGEDEWKWRLSQLSVLKELPRSMGFGENGKDLLAFIEELKTIKWFSNVGKPYNCPCWAQKMSRVKTWRAAGDAARNAARDAAWNAAGDAAWNAAGDAAWAAARDAAWAAAEIVGQPIKQLSFFQNLMQVYRDGHYPVAFDHKKLVVY